MSRQTKSDMFSFTVTIDDRFPECPDTGHVLKGCNDKGFGFLGWWTEANFQEWLRQRNGFVSKTDGDVRTVVARLTKKEQKDLL